MMDTQIGQDLLPKLNWNFETWKLDMKELPQIDFGNFPRDLEGFLPEEWLTLKVELPKGIEVIDIEKIKE